MFSILKFLSATVVVSMLLSHFYILYVPSASVAYPLNIDQGCNLNVPGLQNNRKDARSLVFGIVKVGVSYGTKGWGDTPPLRGSLFSPC